MARARGRSESGRTGRLCDVCGSPYYRCNVTRVWDERNEGHRGGWHKAEQHTCNRCTSPATARRILVLATASSRRAAPAAPAAQQRAG